MKGVIFTELMSFIELRFGMSFADRVIEHAKLPNDGAFTTVGNYPGQQAVDLATVAARLSGVDGNALCEAYGAWLFGRFGVLFPAIMAGYPTAESLLMHVGSHIHHEVCVLYPDARPPEVSATTDGNRMTVTYRSHRPMAFIAHGLIRQCLADMGESRTLRWNPTPQLNEATFVIAPAGEE